MYITVEPQHKKIQAETLLLLTVRHKQYLLHENLSPDQISLIMSSLKQNKSKHDGI